MKTAAATEAKRTARMTAMLLMLAILVVITLAANLLIPVVLAVLLTFLLRPLQRKMPLPRPLSAAILTTVVVVVVLFGLQGLLAPAMGWMERAPQALQRLQTMTSNLEEPVSKVTEATQTVQELTELGNPGVAIPVRIQGGSLDEQLFATTGSALLTITTIVLLLYFLLSYGEYMILNMARALPWRPRIRLLAVMNQLERDFATYMFTITIINACLGTCQALAMVLLGMPDPWLWGAMGFLLNYIPYIGAILGTALVALVAISTHQTWLTVLLPPLSFYLLSATEGYLVTPTILGRRFQLNPLVVLLGLLFWAWLWGIAGALLAVPILVAIKVISERLPSMRPLIYALAGPPAASNAHATPRAPLAVELRRNLLKRPIER